uniref:Uncharacterized protein n=1 Tax=Tanacetum cinerariifolium TaxID=118510 RepID=A0A6L2LRT3_TANCI|nr:hypothetical protein [Tanacetum cinerariifolium]
MVRVESLSDDQLTAKMSVLHYMIMSHGGEFLTRYRGLNQSRHEYVLLAGPRLKGYEKKVASLTGLELQVSTLEKHVSGLNDKLSSSDASFAKSKAKGKERKKKIKSLTNCLDNLHTEGLVRKFLASDEFSRVQDELLSLAASAGFERRLSMHQTKDEFVAMLKKITHFMPGAQGRLAEASPLIAQTDYAFLNKIFEFATEPLSESNVTPAFKSLELSANVAPVSSAVASEQNEEWVNAIVDGSDVKMTDGSELVSFGLTDVVVALFAGEKGDGSLSFFAADEEATANPSGV